MDTATHAALIESLDPGVMIDIRRANGSIELRISYTDAIAEAVRGTVEGVYSPSGRVRYLRRVASAPHRT